MGNLKKLQTGHWCGVLSGRAVAIAEVAGVFLVYIDHVLQGGRRFRTAEAAYQWVCAKAAMVRDHFCTMREAPNTFRPAFNPIVKRARRSLGH